MSSVSLNSFPDLFISLTNFISLVDLMLYEYNGYCPCPCPLFDTTRLGINKRYNGKAYDTLWKEGLLKNLKQMGIMGKMFNYIQNFGKDRTFQVKVGSSLSSTKTQVNGTPQGAVISPTLFNIAINNRKKQ